MKHNCSATGKKAKSSLKPQQLEMKCGHTTATQKSTEHHNNGNITSFPTPKKFKSQPSAGKGMATVL